MRREPDSYDPEPVVVTIGEPSWKRRARIADILIADVSSGGSYLQPGETAQDWALRLQGLLLARYPGLSIVLIRLPGGMMAVGRRATFDS